VPINPSGVVYGVLADSTVIAAESTRHETFGKLLAASAVTIAMYWAAHAYSHHWQERLDHPATWSPRAIVRSFSHEASILAGAALPVGVLVVAWLTGASRETAVTAVLWAAAVELVLLELLPGLRHHLRPADLALQTFSGITMAAGILGVRLLLH
jgi:hypothetical protein